MAGWAKFSDAAISVLVGVVTLAAAILGAGGVLTVIYYWTAAFHGDLMRYFPFALLLGLFYAVFFAVAASILVNKRLRRIHQPQRRAG